MQLFCARRDTFFWGCGRLLTAALFSLFAVGAGCIERPTTIDPPFDHPHSGVKLTIAAADPADRELLQQLAKSWATRSGAQVQVLDKPWDGQADIGLIPPADLANWADSGNLADVPADLKSPAHAYRWDDLLRPYSVRLTNWRDRTCALPVVGEGLVLVYRKDVFDGKNGRPSTPPATWDDLLELAEKLGPRSLPPLPNDAERLSAEFFSAAACYDRPAVSRINTDELIRDPGRFFAFQFDPTSGDARLDSKSFTHVADLFQRMKAYRGTAPDAATAFSSGEAKVGVVSLAELARVNPETKDLIGIAPLPGARFTFEADGTQKPTEQRTINRIPYVGWGGRLGVVSSTCTAKAAAWDFLVDAGLPDTTALDLIANPKRGAGPYRNSQLDGRARPRWFALGLSVDQTDRLTAALVENLNSNVLNYRLRLRTPNQAQLSQALDEDLRRVILGKGPADLSAANKRWQEIIDRQPRAEWRNAAAASLGVTITK